MKKSGMLVLWAAFMVLVSERSAHAYIDPGSGSLLLQALLGGLAGLGVLVKMYWRRLLSGFRRQDAEDRG